MLPQKITTSNRIFVTIQPKNHIYLICLDKIPLPFKATGTCELGSSIFS